MWRRMAVTPNIPRWVLEKRGSWEPPRLRIGSTWEESFLLLSKSSQRAERTGVHNQHWLMLQDRDFWHSEFTLVIPSTVFTWVLNKTTRLFSIYMLHNRKDSREDSKCPPLGTRFCLPSATVFSCRKRVLSEHTNPCSYCVGEGKLPTAPATVWNPQETSKQDVTQVPEWTKLQISWKFIVANNECQNFWSV